jgi:serine protease Do
MKRFLFFVVLVALCIAALYRWNEQRRQGERRPEKFTPAERSRIDLNDVKVLAAMEDEYVRLVDAVVPSVVSITASRTVRLPYVVDPFELFFGRQSRRPQMGEQKSLGSGVIVSKEGHILTNHHVVAQVDQVQVQLSSGKEYPAKVIGSDEQTDIAVLKVDLPGLTPLPLADSDQVRVGQRVIAVGNPFGLEETVTQGIISAKGRRAMEESANEFFQTDAAINPGNSGGPLVNLKGEVIGINAAIFSTGSGNGAPPGWQGVGFAIPSNVARRVLESIIKTGRVVRGYIGVVIQPVTDDLAQQFKLPDSRGALVAQVTPESPAEKAGLKSGDVIREFNGHLIRDTRELQNRVAEVGVGAKVDVLVIRDGKDVKSTLEVAEQPADLFSQAPSRMPPPRRQIPGQPANHALAGVQVAEIPDSQRGQFPENVRGVLVTGVDRGSPSAGVLQPGDVIEEINHQPVSSVDDFRKIVESGQPGEKQLLIIVRGRVRSFVVITPR